MEEKKVIPRHVGIIMDGNGRWAEKRGKKRSYGHKKGAEVIEEVVTECFEKGVEVVSLYAFSTENWLRPKEEIDAIFGLLGVLLKNKLSKLVKQKVKLVISGDVDPIPEKLKKDCLAAVEKTKDFTEKTLNVALNYGSRTEIVRAVNLAVKRGVTEFSEADIASGLYTSGMPDIDLVIRTSGEMRLSNFFLWQCAYAEFYFTDVLWPDFRADEADKALEWFSHRKRRFGGIRSQNEK